MIYTQKKNKKVFIQTFGCQMNKLDSELLSAKLIAEGFLITKDKKEADIILFNTCSVRQHAEERAFSNIGSVKFQKRKNPDLIIGVIGCMAQNYKDKILERVPFVDVIVGSKHLGELPEILNHQEKIRFPYIDCRNTDGSCLTGSKINRPKDIREIPFQAYVKVMEGCDCSCSFCVVPFTRGKARSREPGEILEEIRRLADDGCVEVTLLGQTVDAYGLDLSPRKKLAELLYEVSNINGIRRIRFCTSHPAFVSRDLIEAIGNISKVCKYIHLPVQSGSTRILKLMRRGYTSEKYLEIVDVLRENAKGIEIATDFIVGFPTEREEDFQMTVKLMKMVRFQNSFVFKYSARPNTKANSFEDDVPLAVKKERNQTLLEEQKKISLEKNESQIGKILEVLVEGESKINQNLLSGRTDTNAIVVFEGSKDLIGRFVRTKVNSATSLTLFGRVVD